jgi:release factor glutamine methyltransferase
LNLQEAYFSAIQTIASVYEKEEAKAIVQRLFKDKYKIFSKDLLLQNDAVFEHEADLNHSLNLLLNQTPIQHIIGFEWFCGMPIKVNPNVLIPRPETEELVQWIISSETLSTESIADICTGSGCLALALKNHFKYTRVTATDISELALATAQENATQLALDIQLFKHDVLKDAWNEAIPQIVVSNPPYIKKEESLEMSKNVLLHEPHLALFVEDDDALLFYKKIILQFAFKGSKIYFELNPLTAFELKNHCETLGLNCELKQDMQGKWRFARIN